MINMHFTFGLTTQLTASITLQNLLSDLAPSTGGSTTP
jgi:hypothetical protein